MFEAFRDGRGMPSARCFCSRCGNVTTIRAQHERRRGNEGATVIEGQALRKLTDMGWQASGNRLVCPSCVAKTTETDLPTGESQMAQDDTLRGPTREQKREIMDLLQEVYDTKAERYRGLETDETVAEAVGNGVLHGWVARLREEFFGPNGNEGQEVLARDIAEWRATGDSLAERMHNQLTDMTKTLREFNEARAKVAELAEALDRIRKQGRAVRV